MRNCALALTATLLAVAGCGGGNETVSTPPPKAPATITLRSPAFKTGGELPKQYTCDGSGVTPPLTWFSVPRKAKELALLVEDPDAPGGTFVHWSVWGIPGSATGLLQGVATGGLQQGKNGFGNVGYGPPCPPKGATPHRYVFTLYALSQPLGAGNGASGDEVQKAIGDVAIAKGSFTTMYGR